MKKLLVMLVAIISVLSIGYAFNNNTEMKAAGNYQSGGSVTGRINKAPTGITNTSTGIKKGDKVLMGTKNPNNTNPLTWILLQNETYTDHSCTTYNNVCASNAVTAWLSMVTEEVANTYMGLKESDFIYRANEARPVGVDYVGRYANSNIYNNVIIPLNQSLMSQDRKIIAPRNLTRNHERILSDATDATSLLNRNLNIELFQNTAELGSNLFLPDTEWATLPFSNKLAMKDAAFSKIYWSSSMDRDVGTTANESAWSNYVSYIILASGEVPTLDYRATPYSANAITDSIRYAVRPAAYLDMSKVVFAVSKNSGATTSLGTVTLPKNLPSSYTNIMNETQNSSPMKLRLENTALTNSTSLNDLKNKLGSSITKASKNTTIYLDANARAGNDGNNGVYTVSAIVFDSQGQFKYYKPLENAKGNGSYEFDLTGIPTGDYKIGIVNEAYNDTSTAPADSSLISAVKTLTIVNPLTITATASTGLEYGKNVNQNDTVATYSTSNGVNPITATLESDTSVSGHSNDYQLFSLNNGKVLVKNANGLNAGDYYFKIKAVDSNGDPNDGVYTNTIHVIVAKTDPTVVFDDPNETKKSAANAATAWFETATATPTTDIKIIYDISGGKSTLVSINPNTGEVTYIGNGDYGKVEIRATVDDDPAIGNNNYNSKEVRKVIFIYREVDANVVPDSNSSSTAVPTFSASDPNIKTNGTIGTIIGTKGTPDNITSGGTTYSYEIKSGAGDGNLFRVDKSSGVIQAAADLGVKSYSFTITVSDKFSSKDIDVVVNVGTAPAEDLSFYETNAAINRITQKSVKSTDTNVIVYATVKDSKNKNQVTYKIKDGSTNVIDVNPISGAVTIHGVGTVTIVAEKDGESGQAKAQAELEFTVTAGSQNFIYTDNAGNELSKSGSIYNAKTEVYAPNKAFQLYTAGNPAGSAVTYKLKSGSPTDVISVDSNGLVTILNASLTNQMGKVIVQATSHDTSGNYEDKTIELPINIEKGTRVISFAENPIYVTSGKGKVTPITEVDGSTDTDGDVLVEVDSNEDHTIAWTNDNKTIDYNYSGKQEKISKFMRQSQWIETIRQRKQRERFILWDLMKISWQSQVRDKSITAISLR